MLSIVFAVENFHQYVFGKEAIIVESDHKPIESIMKKPLKKATPRLQRLMLRLQPYDLKIQYVAGKFMYVADTLSCAYCLAHRILTLMTSYCCNLSGGVDCVIHHERDVREE